FRIRHDVELVPALPEQTYQAARLADLEIAHLVHHVAQKEVAPEHRHAPESANSAAPPPAFERGQQHVEALRSELVVDELLAVAVRPQHVPALLSRDRFQQGFAPFGLLTLSRVRPIVDCYLRRADVEAGRAAALRSHTARVTGH